MKRHKKRHDETYVDINLYTIKYIYIYYRVSVFDIYIYTVYIYIFFCQKNREKKHSSNSTIPLVSPILRTSLACHVWDFPIDNQYIYIYIYNMNYI